MGLVDSGGDRRKGQRRITGGETIEEVIVSYAVRARARPEYEQRSPAVPEKVLEAALPAAVEQRKIKARHNLANVLCLHSAHPVILACASSDSVAKCGAGFSLRRALAHAPILRRGQRFKMRAEARCRLKPAPH